MKNLKQISNTIMRNLTKKEEVREKGIRTSREINRASRSIVHDIHKGRDVGKKLRDLRRKVAGLNTLMKNYPELLHGGFVENALQEYAEASILNAFVNNETLPKPSDLHLDDTPYALGMADVVGELRRIILNQIIENDLKSAKKYFRAMESITEAISKFNFPDAMIPIRRKQDVARSLLEKTQGELAVALAMQAK
jgi:translin